MAKVYWRIKYTLAPKFEDNVYSILKHGGLRKLVHVIQVKTLARVWIGKVYVRFGLGLG